ncbi:MAG: cell division protein ZapA [Pseudomonadota bacterium]
MAEVRVEIGGRPYRLACEDGQETHLTALARRLDAEATRIGAGATVPEGRLLVMCALSLADRLADAEAQIARLEAEIARAGRGGGGGAALAEPAVAGEAEAALSERIEAAAARLALLAER